MSLRRLFAPAVAAVALAASVGPLAPAGAIVGGSAAPEGAYPFMAALVDGDDFQFCGGSVIASSWVLTAAHCVENGSANNLWVITGRTNLGNTSQGQRIKVQAVFVHPTYQSQGHDAALLQLSVPTTSPAIQLAVAADDIYESPGTPVRVTGWGDQTNTLGLTSTPQLRYADLKVVGDAQCGRTNFGFDPATGVCAAEILKDSCQGDSGGPLFTTGTPARIQLGIVSYGTGCALPQFPGVYSEVNNASIRQFITDKAHV
jgi:trypsin